LDNRPGGPPNSGRLLELADIALGLKSLPQKSENQPLQARMTKARRNRIAADCFDPENNNPSARSLPRTARKYR